jgi:hypothetical protein
MFEEIISLPNLKTFSLMGCEEFLHFMELDHLENLSLGANGHNQTRNIGPSSIPINLRELILGQVRFPAGSTRHYLPHLTKFELYDAYLGSPLRELLEIPNIETLVLHDIHFDSPNSQHSVLNNEERGILLSDAQFFQGLPVLKHLSMASVPLSGDLVVSLRSCPMLRRLSLEGCEIKSFLLFFADDRPYSSYLPALRDINISKSWPYSAGMTYTDFISRLSSLMPVVEIYGDDEGLDTYYSYPKLIRTRYSD